MDFLIQFRTVVFTWIRNVGLLCGHDILNANFKVNFHTIVMPLLILTLPLFYITTAIFYDGELAFKAGACIFMGLYVARQAAFAILASSRIRANIEVLENFYKQHLKTEDNWKLFSHFARTLKLVVKLLIIIYLADYVLAILSPLVIYALTNGSVYESILPFVLPGTSPDQTLRRVLC